MKKDYLLRIYNNRYVPILCFFLCIVGVSFRFLIPYAIEWLNSDLMGCILPWISEIRDNGFHTYATEFTDYAPAYTYILGLISILPEDLWVVSVKGVSALFDVIIAVSVYGIIIHLNNKKNICDRSRPWIGALLVIWYPTVGLNSGLWGQCDSIWTAFCMLSLFMIIKEKPILALTFFAIAFSFKLQAMFFAPVILLQVFRGKIKWWLLLIIPAVYVILCLPCSIAGRSWGSLLSVYLGQYDAYPRWSLNSASLCSLLSYLPYNFFAAKCIVIGTGILVLFLTGFWGRKIKLWKVTAQDEILIMFTAFMAVLIPWLLPMMHERYMYLGDVSTLLCAVYFLSRGWVWTAINIELASLLNVLTFLFFWIFSQKIILINYLSVILVTEAIFLMIVQFKCYMDKQNSKLETNF